MSPTAEKLREELLALPTEERRALIASVSDPGEYGDFNLHPDWDAELDRRSEALASGEDQGVTWDEARRRLDAIVNRR